MSERTTIAIPRTLHKRLKLLSVTRDQELQEMANTALELGMSALESPAPADRRTTTMAQPAARARAAA